MILYFMRNHDGQWSELATTFDHQYGDMYYFVAMTPGFSFFGITTRVKAATMNTSIVTATPAATGIPDTGTPPASTTIPTSLSAPRPAMIQTTAVPASGAGPAGSSGIPVIAMIAGIGGIVIVAVGGFFARRWWLRRQNPALFKEYD